MSRLQSIRWRLQLWHGLLLMVALGGFGMMVYRMEGERQLHRADEGLQRRLQTLASSRHPVPDAWPPRQKLALSPQNASLFDQDDGGGGFYYVVWLRSNSSAIRSASAAADVPMPEDDVPSGTRMRGQMRETFLFPAPNDCLLVGHRMDRDLEEVHHLAWWLAAAGGGMVLIGLLGGAYLVRRALKPIDDISAAAQKVAMGDLTQRIAGPSSGSELGELVNVLNATFARLDAAFARQAQFTADAAHELRTPVSVMLAQAQYGLTITCDNDEHRESLEAIQRAASRMRRLIESLLELARLDAGQESPRRDWHDLALITHDCMETLRPLAEARGIQIHGELGSAVCACDADGVAQVTTNLLTNAIHYNHDGGEVHIATQRAHDTAVLVIRNTGPGIAKDDLPKIFDRFYRADKVRNSKGGHTGLGLAICKAIVQAHGGSIEAASEPGGWTTFTVSLPG